MTRILLLICVLCAPALSAQALYRLATESDGKRSSYYNIEPPKPRAWRVHDLITIKIGERVSARRTDSIETRKQADLRAQLKDWVAIDGGTGNLVPAAPQAPGINISTDYDVENDAARKRLSQFSDVITAEVVQVLPNGHLEVRAFKEITVMQDTERVELTCRIDPETIDLRFKGVDASRTFGLRIS